MSAPGAEKRTILYEKLRLALPEQLPAYLQRQRWFGGKARQIHSAELLDLIPFQTGQVEAFILLARVEYQIGQGETYVLPLAYHGGAERPAEEAVVLRFAEGGEAAGAVLADALRNEQFLRWLLDAIEVKVAAKGMKGEIRASHNDIFQGIRSNAGSALEPRLLKGEQSNNSIAYGDRLILKFFRRVEEGVNPDLEIGVFLTEKAHFPHVPAVAGWLEYRTDGGAAITVGILQEFAANQGDAWRFTLDQLREFWNEAAKRSEAFPTSESSSAVRVLDYEADLPAAAMELAGSYLEKAELLGRRTAELHLALASNSVDPAFAPEPYTQAFQSDWETRARELAARNLATLREKVEQLPENARAGAREILEREAGILERLRSRVNPERSGMRTRIHGDYHLGQVLYTGSDFMIIDFEGEPARPLAERRSKHSPIQDVAGMVRSFHYAAFAHLLKPEDAASPGEDPRARAAWAERWYTWVVRCFLHSYFAVAQSGSFLPPSREEISALLQAHLLEKAIYELGYELNNRPTWVAIPLAGISQLLAS